MEPINIELVDYYGQQIAPRHFTDNYDLVQTNKDTAIYRRGYNFYLAIRFDRDFIVDKDVLRIEFKFGPKPKKDITRIPLILRPQQRLPDDPNQWGIALDRVDPNYVVVEIHIAANAPVGIWSCSLRTNIKGFPKEFRNFQVPNDFYIIFNPWNREDGVYLENENDRNEYIFSDVGKIWLGTSWYPQGRNWIFGQFDDIALRTAVFLLDKSKLEPENRGDPVLVSRAISAIINSDDDNGLLVANWNGDFSDGTPPYAWTGSKPILEQYYNSGGAPVRYGQCWVFSAVTVTICRALGIPCRSSTVYVSGQGSKNITKNYDAFGNLIEDNQSNETLWSFHAWNEVWLARPKIPKRFSGWQIIDATPLRRSDGIMRCGPASVEAVKQGFTDYQYDTDFVFQILNADISRIVVDEDSELGEYQLPKNGYQSGKKVVTKAVGSDDIWDVTPIYKALEEVNIAESNELSFELITDKVPLGETLNVTMRVTNNTNSTKNIWTALAGRSVYYTGKQVSIIDRRDDNFSIKQGETRALPPLSIPASKYIPALVDHGFIKLYAFGMVKNGDKNGQRWAEEEDFVFTQPLATMSAGKLYYKIGDTIDVRFSFRNPVNVTLTNCVYMVEGPGDVPKSIRYKDVPPLEEVSIPISFTTGRRTGVRRIIVNFTSQPLVQVTGSLAVNIVGK
ncbi:hemocyte protein-glutamine gamma-glutamyltransferase-like [Anoplophora glabripennis]|uniref:hemocyte protein-glutamine gamma-glutamyltransferase-like n=1 Tax=Anoplophora glabripennis TaxID=217634 RepID=UPI000873823D|nr:hemocyte protein-glutamine gamma-glutamyltransferase-like [Anoplophora glabripennis]